MADEQSFIMIKPDGVQRGLVGDIIKRFETKGFFLKGLKVLNVSRELAQTHYADLSSKPFYGDLVDYIISGPVVAMVWEGKNVVLTGRKMIGATNPVGTARLSLIVIYIDSFILSLCSVGKALAATRRLPRKSLNILLIIPAGKL